MIAHYPFQNQPLPYAFDALQPFIDAKTMELHHDRHLQAYVDNLNAALKNSPVAQTMSLNQLIIYGNKLPPAIRTAVAHNAGGVYNHRFFFDGMTPVADMSQNELTRAISKKYGTLDEFRKQFTAAALSVFGSGYAWLTVDGRKNMSIITTANQDAPLTPALCPVLCIDVWEHAYYLKHYNKRGDYISDWFNVINWDRAGTLYTRCMA